MPDEVIIIWILQVVFSSKSLLSKYIEYILSQQKNIVKRLLIILNIISVNRADSYLLFTCISFGRNLHTKMFFFSLLTNFWPVAPRSALLIDIIKFTRK